MQQPVRGRLGAGEDSSCEVTAAAAPRRRSQLWPAPAPIPASSGRTVRHRLNRGGDRALNCAIHTIALARIRSCPRTPRLRAATHRRGKDPTRDPPLPQALHRPRALVVYSVGANRGDHPCHRAIDTKRLPPTSSSESVLASSHLARACPVAANSSPTTRSPSPSSTAPCRFSASRRSPRRYPASASSSAMNRASSQKGSRTRMACWRRKRRHRPARRPLRPTTAQKTPGTERHRAPL
jgi:hypothetical protein